MDAPSAKASEMSADPRFEEALLTEEVRAGAAFLAACTGEDAHDVLVVLGSGLAQTLDAPPSEGGWGEPRVRLALDEIPGVLAPVADGHVSELRSYTRAGQRILVALGRTHLYEGVTPLQVTALARIAAAAGVQRAVLCNANGCLRDWNLGEVMVIRDHLNFSGSSPFNGPLFLDIMGVWDPELSALAQAVCERVGTYALMRGPEYQTMAESRWLAAAGADCVGMSTIIEAITLHALGVRVCGMSVVSDLSFADGPTDPQAVVEAASHAAMTLRTALERVLNAQ